MYVLTAQSDLTVDPFPRELIGMRLLKAAVKSALQAVGYDIVRHRPDAAGAGNGRGRVNTGAKPPDELRLPPELDAADEAIIRAVKPYTMTTYARLVALTKAVVYLVAAGVSGDIVECGVWKGGSMMLVAQQLVKLGDTSRHLYLYDTFQGMPPPTTDDVAHHGETAEQILARSDPSAHVWAVAPLEGVRSAMLRTGYPPENLHFVRGRVEDTLPQQAPARISLLRLDTDWYESTRHELVHLYPLLAEGGVLIVDDYGFWRGSRKAVDEYFAHAAPPPLLHVIDYAGRIGLKTGSPRQA